MAVAVRLVAVLMFAMMLLGHRAAASNMPVGAVCDIAAQRAAQNTGVPIGILLSIARVETGRAVGGQFAPWPWSANVSGNGYFFDSADEAIVFANDLLASGNVNFDVGCFQINLRWHSKNFGSLKEAFDPELNAAYAAQFLTELFQSEGSWAAAVAAYHSRTPDLAQRYLQKVKATWEKMRGQNAQDNNQAEMPTAAQVVQLVPRINRYPLLQGGEIGNAGSIVPQLGAGTILIGQN
jgi:soluble lytic murein transglycosylase-like protein